MVLSLVLMSLGSAGIGHGQDNGFPDNPKNHWAYKGIAYLTTHGLSIETPDTLWYRGVNSRTRYALAVAYNAAAAHLRSLTETLQKEAETISTSVAPPKNPEQLSDQEQLLNSVALGRSIDVLERGVREFKKELLNLGADPNGIIIAAEQFKSNFAHFHFPKPGSALKPFSDVPPNHWAFAATTNLRALGILHGYPDRTFNGN